MGGSNTLPIWTHIGRGGQQLDRPYFVFVEANSFKNKITMKNLEEQEFSEFHNEALKCQSIIYLAELANLEQEFDQAYKLSNKALRIAREKRNERSIVQASIEKLKACLGLGNADLSDSLLPEILATSRDISGYELELQSYIVSAKFSFKLEKMADARSSLDNVWDAVEEGPYPLHQTDAYNVLADICRTEGDDDAGGIDAATKAYRAAWCDGPPWAYHWGLEKAKANLQALGAPQPQMPPFDESKYDPMPEVEINPKDEYWVDPSKTLGALLDLT